MKKNYAALTTKDQKAAAIAGAKTEAELDAMWEAWEACGWGKDGLLYGAVLARKRDIGVGLSEGDADRLAAAEMKRKHGATLPPITGNLGG